MFREFLGLSQQALADELGSSKRGIQDNETRNRVPGGDVINGLVRLGVNANWLLTGEGPMLLQKPGLRLVDSGYPIAAEPAPEGHSGLITHELLQNCLRACQVVHGEPFAALTALDQLGYAADLYNLVVQMPRGFSNGTTAALRLEVTGLADQLKLFLRMGSARPFPPSLPAIGK